jgi:hypothetical protein
VPPFISFAGTSLHTCPAPTSVQGSLELASKNFITGATKIVYAIIYSLILVSLSESDSLSSSLDIQNP